MKYSYIIIVIFLSGCKSKNIDYIQFEDVNKKQNEKKNGNFNLELKSKNYLQILINLKTRNNDFPFLIRESGKIKNKIIKLRSCKICQMLRHHDIFHGCSKTGLKNFLIDSHYFTRIHKIVGKNLLYFNSVEIDRLLINKAWTVVLNKSKVNKKLTIKNVVNLNLIGIKKEDEKKIKLENVENVFRMSVEKFKKIKNKKKEIKISKIKQVQGFDVKAVKGKFEFLYEGTPAIEYLRIDYPLKHVRIHGKIVCGGLDSIKTIDFADINNVEMCNKDYIKWIRNTKNVSLYFTKKPNLINIFKNNKITNYITIHSIPIKNKIEKIFKAIKSTKNVIKKVGITLVKMNKVPKIPNQLQYVGLKYVKIKNIKVLKSLKPELLKQGYMVEFDTVRKKDKNNISVELVMITKN